MKVQLLLIFFFIIHCFAHQPQWDYSTDSQAVRIIIDSGGCTPSFFDSNGNEYNPLSEDIVEYISDSSNGRIRALHLGNIFLTCGPAHLRREIGHLTELEEFEMNSSHITGLPDELFTLQNLRSLNISSNLIDSLPAGIGNLRKLKTLQVAGCSHLKKISESIGNLDSLEILDLRSDSLRQLPSTIGSCKKLWWIRLDDNKLDSIPFELGNCMELFLLEIDGNNITSLPSSIGNLIKLSELSLFNNKLIELPKEISNLRMLNRLYLDGNRLQSLPDSIINLNLSCGVSGNKLCNQPVPIKVWLDAHAGADWWESQVGCSTSVIQAKAMRKPSSPTISCPMEIFDLSGRKIRIASLFKENIRLNLPRGVYIMRQKNAGIMEIKKFLVGQ